MKIPYVSDVGKRDPESRLPAKYVQDKFNLTLRQIHRNDLTDKSRKSAASDAYMIARSESLGRDVVEKT